MMEGKLIVKFYSLGVDFLLVCLEMNSFDLTRISSIRSKIVMTLAPTKIPVYPPKSAKRSPS